MRLWLLAALFLPAAADANPIVTGDLAYRLSWNGIPAADASVHVTRAETDGQPIYRVEAAARTRPFVDLFWSLRAQASSSFTANGFAPLGFRYDRRENERHSLTSVAFDLSPPAAIGTRYRGSDTSVVDVRDIEVLDPITAAFRALTQPVRIGDLLPYEVFTGEARYHVEFAITGEESVTVAAGTFNAWRIEPHVWKIGSGPEQRLRHATIWVSEEPARAIIRIRSDVFIGAVNCDLMRLGPSPAS